MKRRAKRISIAVLGGLLLPVGIVAIPYPGPGWLIVFAGLAILATEFDWAQKLLDTAKGKYDAWQDWLSLQAWWVKAIFWTLTCAVVVVTLWLLNGYGLIDDWLSLGLDWVHSPLSIFSK